MCLGHITHTAHQALSRVCSSQPARISIIPLCLGRMAHTAAPPQFTQHSLSTRSQRTVPIESHSGTALVISKQHLQAILPMIPQCIPPPSPSVVYVHTLTRSAPCLPCLDFSSAFAAVHPTYKLCALLPQPVALNSIQLPSGREARHLYNASRIDANLDPFAQQIKCSYPPPE